MHLRSAGQGQPVGAADVVTLTVRAAREIEHLDDRLQTLVNTGPDAPVEVTLGDGDLLPEVFDALIGVPVGSTVVVEVDARAHRLEDAVGAATYFLELTLTDVRERAPEAVHVLAERAIPEPAELAARRRRTQALVQALKQAARQPNGRVVRLDDDLHAYAEPIARRLARERHLTRPHSVGEPGDSRALVLDETLWTALLTEVTRTPAGEA